MAMQPEELKGIRKKLENNKETYEVLIKWQDLLDSEATWEDYEEISGRFPSFHLEDKVRVWAGAILSFLSCGLQTHQCMGQGQICPFLSIKFCVLIYFYG